MKENAYLFKEYQTYFNDFFAKRNYNAEILDFEDDDINYVVDLPLDIKDEKCIIHILFYIDVVNRRCTIFCSFPIPTNSRFFNRFKFLSKTNELNSLLPYGKLFSLKNKLNYMAKLKLPEDMSCFDPDIIERCIFEITHTTSEFFG